MSSKHALLVQGVIAQEQLLASSAFHLALAQIVSLGFWKRQIHPLVHTAKHLLPVGLQYAQRLILRYLNINHRCTPSCIMTFYEPKEHELADVTSVINIQVCRTTPVPGGADLLGKG